jgi:putative tributyrin esterase
VPTSWPVRETGAVARLRVDFFAETLGLGTSMTVLLPQHTSAQVGLATAAGGGPPPVLYLLHGLSDDDTAWSRWTSVERYAADLGLAVVMPQVHRSFYTDEPRGGRYFAFLSEELPDLVTAFFRISDRREDTFVAGLSMGGYGAWTWALRQPHRFAAAASLSGALDVAALLRAPDHTPDLDRIFADDRFEGTDNDVLHLVEQADPATLPRLWLGCGAEDELYPHTVALADACARRGIPVTVELGPGGHDWAYWDRTIRQVLAWLPVR